MKYSKHFLSRLEDLISETNYMLRYERGNFTAGWCILKDNNIIIINKFFALDGKISCLLDIIRTIDIDHQQLSDKNKKLYLELAQTELPL